MVPLIALLCALSAQASPEVGADVGLGLVTGQPGADARGRLTLTMGGAYGDVELGIGMRTAALESAIDEPPFPIVGLAALEIGWGPAVSHTTRVGVMGAIDAALLPSVERDCGSDGCRHWSWVGGATGVGLSYAPAAGLGVRHEAPRGNRFEVSVAAQPTVIYDVWVPFAPRIETAWTHRNGWRVGARAHRYGVVLLIGALFPGA